MYLIASSVPALPQYWQAHFIKCKTYLKGEYAAVKSFSMRHCWHFGQDISLPCGTETVLQE